MPLIGTFGAGSSRTFGAFNRSGIPTGTFLRFINNSGTATQQQRNYGDPTNRSGPSQAQLNAAYAGTYLAGTTSLSGGFQKWVVPSDFTGRINAVGANGGKDGYNRGVGRGTYLQYTFNFKAGDIIVVGVGQGGANQYTSHSSDGGGGASGIAISRNPGGDAASYSVTPGWLGLTVFPLIIAGGGAGESSDQAGRDASTTRTPYSAGSGVGPGGSWSTDLTTTYTGAGASFVNGGAGGAYTAPYNSDGSNSISGGFGMGAGGSTTSATHNDSAGGGGWVGGSSNSSGPSGGSSYLFTGDGNGYVGYNSLITGYDGQLYIEVL
jgi:hypothetical protein